LDARFRSFSYGGLLQVHRHWSYRCKEANLPKPDQNRVHAGDERGRKGGLRLDVLSVVLIVVALSLAAFQLLPQVHFSVLYALGRSPVCPFDLAMKSGEMIRGHVAIEERILAESRFLEKDEQGHELWQTPDGPYWIPSGEEKTLSSILAEMNRHVYGSGETGVRPGDVVIDCGAHVGAFTRQALAAGAKLVVSVEPSPVNAELLRRNLADEIQAGRVIVYQKGVWNEESSLPFFVDPNNSAGSSFVFEDHAGHDHSAAADSSIIEVPLTTIDALVAELGLEKVDFIKMDIEGAEQNALRGAVQTLKTFRPHMALASYHVVDDQFRIPELVQAARNDYQMHCGPCGEREMTILPHTLLFQ
jgi:FkbM family methyltransferase